MKTPYIQIFSDDLSIFALKMDAQEFKDCMVGVADLGSFGKTSFEPKSELQKLFWERLLASYKIVKGIPQKEQHWNWKGGKTPLNTKIRTSPRYKKWRKKIFFRDNYSCQDCGQRGGRLNAHHIQKFSMNKRLRFSLSNGITLCISCHKKRHLNEK